VLLGGVSATFATPKDDVWGPASSYQTYFHRGGSVSIPAGKDTKAFSSQTVTCPSTHTKGCAIRVKTTIRFEGIVGQVMEKIFLNGLWVDSYTFSEASPTSFDDERTIFYVWPSINPGQGTKVDVKLYSDNAGTATGESYEMVELLLL